MSMIDNSNNSQILNWGSDTHHTLDPHGEDELDQLNHHTHTYTLEHKLYRCLSNKWGLSSDRVIPTTQKVPSSLTCVIEKWTIQFLKKNLFGFFRVLSQVLWWFVSLGSYSGWACPMETRYFFEICTRNNVLYCNHSIHWHSSLKRVSVCVKIIIIDFNKGGVGSDVAVDDDNIGFFFTVKPTTGEIQIYYESMTPKAPRVFKYPACNSLRKYKKRHWFVYHYIYGICRLQD